MLKNFTAPFILIRRDGWTAVFDDMETLAASIRESRITVCENHQSHIGFFKREFALIENEWIVRDDRGRTVTADDIAALSPFKYGFWGICADRRTEAQHAASLGLPIPYTGKRSGYRYYRRPKGMAAYREDAGRIDYRNEDVKPKGKIKLPPNAWDDIGRASYFDRNWKAFRKTRWKE